MAFWNPLSWGSKRIEAQARRDAMDKVTRHLARRDSWFNVKNGLGTSRDRRSSDDFEFDPVTDEEAKSLWRGDSIAARIIEVRPRETYRRGLKLKMQDRTIAEKMLAWWEDLEGAAKFRQAREYANAYGGGAVMPVINDGQKTFAAPLNEKGGISGIKCLHVFEPRELRVLTYYNDITSKGYRRPELYQLIPIHPSGGMGSMQVIHESRLIVFPGTRVSEDQSDGTHPGWGDSALCRPKRAIADYGMSWRAATSLLDNFAQGVLSMDGFTELLATDRDDLVLKRLMNLDQMKSSLRTMVIDGKDKFSREQTPLSGLTDMMRELGVYLATTADMPATILLGISPGGLNATGDSDIRSWYDRIDGDRNTLDLPRLERMFKLMFLSNDGPTKGKEPPEWSVEFNPLYQPTEKEIADRNKVIADTDAVNIDKQIYTAAEARERYKGDTMAVDIHVEGDLPEAPTPEDIADIAAARLARQQPAKKPGLVEPDDEETDKEAPTPPSKGEPAPDVEEDNVA